VVKGNQQKYSMKILHLVHAYYPAIGGSEYLVQQVSEYLVNGAGDDVTVFTTFAYNSALFSGRKPEVMPKSRENEVINNVKIRRFPVVNRWANVFYVIQYILYHIRFPGNGFWRKLYYGPLSPEMRRAVEDFDADIIVSAPFPLNHMNYGFKNRKKAPVILMGCMHTADKHGFHNRWILKAIQKADGYIALTSHEKRFLVEEWGIDENKTIIAIIGVGIDVKPPSVPGNHIREQVGIVPRVPLIAFIGQHGLHKGINILIKAMPRVWEKFPDARLVIAGGTTPFTGSFKKLARSIDRGQQGRIHFMDNVDENRKYGIIESCDIFASPSGYESFGITILEAWMKKKPVVACNIEATRNLVRDGETGFLVEYYNHSQLAETLIRLIENPGLRKKVGENGYKKLKENYTKEIIGKKFRDFYDKILSSKQ
jgi:glycosyltransferase involved in cell wall biosynthesis